MPFSLNFRFSPGLASSVSTSSLNRLKTSTVCCKTDLLLHYEKGRKMFKFKQSYMCQWCVIIDSLQTNWSSGDLFEEELFFWDITGEISPCLASWPTAGLYWRIQTPASRESPCPCPGGRNKVQFTVRLGQWRWSTERNPEFQLFVIQTSLNQRLLLNKCIKTDQRVSCVVAVEWTKIKSTDNQRKCFLQQPLASEKQSRVVKHTQLVKHMTTTLCVYFSVTSAGEEHLNDWHECT